MLAWECNLRDISRGVTHPSALVHKAGRSVTVTSLSDHRAPLITNNALLTIQHRRCLECQVVMQPGSHGALLLLVPVSNVLSHSPTKQPLCIWQQCSGFNHTREYNLVLEIEHP